MDKRYDAVSCHGGARLERPKMVWTIRLACCMRSDARYYGYDELNSGSTVVKCGPQKSCITRIVKMLAEDFSFASFARCAGPTSAADFRLQHQKYFDAHKSLKQCSTACQLRYA